MFAPLENETQEIAQLKARGYLVVPPMGPAN
jgi:hypothetical protein